MLMLYVFGDVLTLLVLYDVERSVQHVVALVTFAGAEKKHGIVVYMHVHPVNGILLLIARNTVTISRAVTCA